MGILREIPPTAGLPLKSRDLLALFSSPSPRLLEEFKDYLGVNYAAITCSGTAALYLILEALKGASRKKTVVIPSYVCPLLPLAVKRAGLKAEPCDINRTGFGFDNDRLKEISAANKDVLAIIAVHLAGVPIDLGPVMAFAKESAAFVIEDCAQALGAEYNGKKAGTIGDLAFFSLCRGKGITTYEGGAIISNRVGLEPHIDAAIAGFVKNDPVRELKLCLLLIGYWIFYRPRLFWPVFRLPQRFWLWMGNRIKAADEDFSEGFPLHAMSRARQAVAYSQFSRIGPAVDGQRKKAALYIKRLSRVKGITVVSELPGTRATYPFIALIYEDAGRRDRVLKMAESSGLGGSIIYALAVPDYEYLKGFIEDKNSSNARSVARRTVTLSTSAFLTAMDMERAIEIIEGN